MPVDTPPWCVYDARPAQPGWFEILFATADPQLPNGRWRFDGETWRDAEGRPRQLWPGDHWRGLVVPADSSEG